MPFKLKFAKQPAQMLEELQSSPGQLAKLRKVRKALGQLELNPRHPGLHSHHYESFPADRDVKVWDSYVENNTPSAWRIFWQYGPDESDGQEVITVLHIGPHP